MLSWLEAFGIMVTAANYGMVQGRSAVSQRTHDFTGREPIPLAAAGGGAVGQGPVRPLVVGGRGELVEQGLGVGDGGGLVGWARSQHDNQGGVAYRGSVIATVARDLGASLGTELPGDGSADDGWVAP